MNHKRNSIAFFNGQSVHFGWNRQANDIKIRILPTPHLLNFQIFPAPQQFQPFHLLNFREFSNSPICSDPPNSSMLETVVYNIVMFILIVMQLTLILSLYIIFCIYINCYLFSQHLCYLIGRRAVSKDD